MDENLYTKLAIAETVCAEIRARGVEIGLMLYLDAVQAAEKILEEKWGPAPVIDLEKAKQLAQAEQAVLDMVAAIPQKELDSSGNWYGWAKPIGEAERARRKLNEATCNED